MGRKFELTQDINQRVKKCLLSKKAELWARIGKVISETKGDADDGVALPLLGRMRSPTKRVACQGGEGKKGRRGWRRCPNRRSHVEDQVVERGRAGGGDGAAPSRPTPPDPSRSRRSPGGSEAG